VCPQFDILWGEMTAAEHLRLFARIKGVENNKIDELIKEKLKAVELSHVENA